jgi:hypothetical protein
VASATAESESPRSVRIARRRVPSSLVSSTTAAE